MLLTVQFPLADLWPFISGSTNRLLKPPWPRARADEDFVRLFGSVRKRLKGGVDEWSGEGIYCDAAPAIRFTPALELGGMFDATRRRGAFRRFFSDGEGASRVEIGIRVRRKGVWWTLKELLEALHDTLALNVTIGRGDHAVKTQLIKAGRPLARLVLRASTSAKAAAEFQPGTWWVRPCTPTLLIEYEQFREFGPLPPGFTAMKNETTFPFELSYGLMKFFDRSIGVWVLAATAGKTTDDDSRRFRIHLLRLHAQREVVTEVLRQIQTQTLTVERTTPQDDQQHPSNRLQRFVVNNIEQMERQTYNGIPQSALLRAAEHIQASVTPRAGPALPE